MTTMTATAAATNSQMRGLRRIPFMWWAYPGFTGSSADWRVGIDTRPSFWSNALVK